MVEFLASYIVANRNRMQLRELLPFRLTAVAFILIIVFSAITATIVHAQTTPDQSAAGTTSISNLSYPAEVVLSDSSVVVDVSFTVSYTNWPMGYALQLSIFNATLTNEYPSGHVVSSSPLTCQEFASMPESTTCGVFSTTQPSGSEFVEFALTLPSAGTYTTLAATALFYNQGQILSGSYSIQYLTITVTSPSSSPSTSLQMPQTPQSTSSIPPSSNSDISALTGVGLLAVVLVIVGAIIVNERRIRRKPPNVDRIPPTEEPKPASGVSKPKSESSSPAVETLPVDLPKKATETVATFQLPTTSMYCSQCRAVISRDSKFCKECGRQVG
jgi:hypothetical protein